MFCTQVQKREKGMRRLLLLLGVIFPLGVVNAKPYRIYSVPAEVRQSNLFEVEVSADSLHWERVPVVMALTSIGREHKRPHGRSSDLAIMALRRLPGQLSSDMLAHRSRLTATSSCRIYTCFPFHPDLEKNQSRTPRMLCSLEPMIA